MSVSFDISLPEKILRERGILKYGEVQKKLDAEVLKYCADFVPKKSGELIASGERATRLGSGNICYSAPYARYQYYGVSKKGKKLQYCGGAKRGSYWFERMKATSRYTLLRDAAIAAGAKAEEKSAKKGATAVLKGFYVPITKYTHFFKTRSKQ